MSANVLLIDDLAIKARTGLHTNTDPKLIEPDIKAAQDIYLQPILGSALLSKLQTLISSNAINATENKVYKDLLDGYIVDTLIYYTLAELPMSLSYQFFNKGVLRKNDDNATVPAMGELIDIANIYKNRAEHYGKRLIMYLKANAVSFPEYNTISTTLDSINPIDDNYSTGIWLDDDYNTCRGNSRPYWPYKP